MAYPTIEQYQIALQHPNTAFTDQHLAGGKIRSSNLGLPLVASGGFALTYALETPGKKYAVRCFHREAKGIERRYASISSKLSTLSSSYFVAFEFQPTGIKLNNARYPLVKMAWADGETLGEFVESNYQDKAKLTNLIASLATLAVYLESQGIAHGDIQEGNLMVADNGRQIQLVDYDGMFVPEIAALGGSELGHRDYQHPKRTSSHFGAHLDRFSFIVLNLSLRALCAKPSLWGVSQSGAGVIVCRANDFAAPGQSKVLQEIARIPGLERDVRNFIAICAAKFSATPTLTEFTADRNIPCAEVPVATSSEARRLGYISQYSVLNAADYEAFHNQIGSMVELVGKIVEVKQNRTRHGLPYIFINFSHWQGKSVKIVLWSTALRGGPPPSESWVGRWVTIRGLVEPVFSNRQYRYEHISITATAATQISFLTEQEAKYRLTPSQAPALVPPPNNAATLQLLKSSQSEPASTGVPASVAPPVQSMSPNQAALQRMWQQMPPSPPPNNGTPTTSRAFNPPVRPPYQGPNSSMQARNEAFTANKRKGFLGWLTDIFS